MKMKQKRRVFSLLEPQGAPFPVPEALEGTILHSPFENLRERVLRERVLRERVLKARVLKARRFRCLRLFFPVSEALEDTILPSRTSGSSSGTTLAPFNFHGFSKQKLLFFFNHSFLGYTGKNAKTNLLNSERRNRRPCCGNHS